MRNERKSVSREEVRLARVRRHLVFIFGFAGAAQIPAFARCGCHGVRRISLMLLRRSIAGEGFVTSQRESFIKFFLLVNAKVRRDEWFYILTLRCYKK